MWNTDDIDDLQLSHVPGRAVGGYALNVRPYLMADDLKPFVVTPTRPARRWNDDRPDPIAPMVYSARAGGMVFDFASGRPSPFATIFLNFRSIEQAKASSLGQYWD